MRVERTMEFRRRDADRLIRGGARLPVALPDLPSDKRHRTNDADDGQHLAQEPPWNTSRAQDTSPIVMQGTEKSGSGGFSGVSQRQPADQRRLRSQARECRQCFLDLIDEARHWSHIPFVSAVRSLQLLSQLIA